MLEKILRSVGLIIVVLLPEHVTLSLEETVLGRKDILGFPINSQAVLAMFNLHLAGEMRGDKGLCLLLSLALGQEEHYRIRLNGIVSCQSVPASTLSVKSQTS